MRASARASEKSAAEATHDDGRQGRKHGLVEGKEEGGDLARALRRRIEDVDEAKVTKVADKLGSSLGEGERVAPEEPLDRNELEDKKVNRGGPGVERRVRTE